MNSTPIQIAKPQQILKDHWGFDSFRGEQESIIRSILNGNDTIAIMPTGAGKSLCYQIPALCLEGCAIVVTPLIALMKDQVMGLKKRGIVAEAIYSGLSYQDMDRILDNCIYGKVKLLYMSPERLKSDLIQTRLPKMKLSFLAVDEAHCISQWGFDFRPPYLEIAASRKEGDRFPIIAVTATATREVEKDIHEYLELRSPATFRQTLSRGNLSFSCIKTESVEEKCLHILKKVHGSAIIYCTSRVKCSRYAVYLNKFGIKASFYHAGLSAEERDARQAAWMNNEIRVIVATKAFGMGVDKSDVRLVIHADAPESLESYIQEAGRAGRDGEKAYGVLLWNDYGISALKKRTELTFPSFDIIREVYGLLGSYYQLAVGSGFEETYDFDIAEFCVRYDIKQIDVYHSLNLLAKDGWLLLSEAIKRPSTLQFTISKRDLSSFLLKNRNYAELIMQILRSYEGIMSQSLPIRESSIMSKLNLSRSELEKKLHDLEKMEVLTFKKASDKPQITFIRPLADSSNLSLDFQRIKFLKERSFDKLKKIEAYINFPGCRQEFMMSYFGENNGVACGICDRCLASRKKKSEFDAIKHKIQARLNDNPLTIQELFLPVGQTEREKWKTVLRFLLQNEIVDKKENKFHWTGEK